MLESPLRFTIVVEAELVHRCVANAPRVADVPLLRSLIDDGPETGHIRSGRLEHREWGDQVIIVEIVIKTEILLVIKAVVKPYRKLVRTHWLHRRSHQFVAVVGWGWNKLEQVNRSGVQTSQRDDVARKQAWVIDAIGYLPANQY